VNGNGRRAARYSAAAISEILRALTRRGCEIGLHGIDAWQSAADALAESNEVRRITGQEVLGVRMHWLYYNGQSPVFLEKAGILYDSTMGYNETIGYLAGTTQVYKPLGTNRLLELPLHIMDTALFCPSRLNLSATTALGRVGAIIRNAAELGGCITVNWHDRSIAPERQWGDFYTQLVEALRRGGARFRTAAETVSWFRMRRSAVFENVRWESDGVRARIAVRACADISTLQLRVHQGAQSFVDLPIIEETTGKRTPDGLCRCTAGVPLPAG
jgi:hypothetical protein